MWLCLDSRVHLEFQLWSRSIPSEEPCPYIVQGGHRDGSVPGRHLPRPYGGGVKRPSPETLLTALLALGLSLRDSRLDSATADEPIHAAAGVAQVKSGTWLVNVEHPQLAKHLFGLSAVGLAGVLAGVSLAIRSGPRSARLFLAGALLLAAVSPLVFDRTLGAEGLMGRLAGRPLFADSNLDWGQHLLRLRDLLSRRGIPSSQVAIA